MKKMYNIKVNSMGKSIKLTVLAEEYVRCGDNAVGLCRVSNAGAKKLNKFSADGAEILCVAGCCTDRLIWWSNKPCKDSGVIDWTVRYVPGQLCM